MERPTGQPSRTKTTTIVVALVAGLVVLLLLFPASGVDKDPPVCRSMFFYVVPCEAWIAWTAAGAAAGLVGPALWVNGRRRAAVGR